MKTPSFIALLVAVAIIAAGCCNRRENHSENSFITTEGTTLLKNGKPYSYIGTNMWYASILASTGEGGNRERFCKELDHLKSIGVTNVRILSGPDAGSDLANPANPECSTTLFCKVSTMQLPSLKNVIWRL